jgi:hypothetical protein
MIHALRLPSAHPGESAAANSPSNPVTRLISEIASVTSPNSSLPVDPIVDPFLYEYTYPLADYHEIGPSTFSP